MNSSVHVYRKHPKVAANVFSRLNFLWLIKLFREGGQRDLEIQDLYETQDHNKSSILGDLLERNWNYELEKYRKDGKYKPSLLKALAKTFYPSFISQFLVLFVYECGARVALPYLLGRLIICFNKYPELPQDAYWITTALIIDLIFCSYLVHHNGKNRALLGMRMRIACCSLLYRKVLRLKLTSLVETSNGQIINLLSNDVIRFDYLAIYCLYFFILPFQLAIITYLIWTNVQLATVAGIVILILQTLPVQGYIGHKAAQFRLRIAELTDSRVLLMNEIVQGIQVIKMYGWELPFEKIVKLARQQEVHVIKLCSMIKGYNYASVVFTERITLLVTTVSYFLLGNVVTAEIAFALAQYINILQTTMAFYYPNAIIMAAETFISINRLQEFYLIDEEKVTPEYKADDPARVKKGEILTRHLTATWSSDVPVLKRITTRIQPGQLCAIIGPVGSGKSSFLNAILKEITICDGSIHQNGVVSYAAQEPWLFQGSVRNNILFGLPYDKRKYRQVVLACSLNKDFEQFSYADQTIIGENGASLSGGQRARINLARCVYRDADLYLLDDPLSAVDTHVGKHLFNECIQAYLYQKTRVLVTHQIQHLQHVNHIIVLQNGTIVAEGTYSELVANKLEFTKFLQEKDPVEIAKAETVPRMSLINKRLSVMGRASVVFSDIPTYDELAETGSLDTKLYWKYFRAAGSLCQIFFLILILVTAELICIGNDIWLSYWTSASKVLIANNHTSNQFIDDADDKLLSFQGYLSMSTIICIYIGFTILTVISSTTRCLYFYNLCMNASINLHNKMFHSLLEAPMRFFDANPIGRILNRFSKDVGACDELLPRAIIEWYQISSSLIGIIVIVAIFNVYMLLPTIILLFGFVKLRQIFLKTAQDIKRIEGITRSPVFSHTSSTMTGITTIRACKAQETLLSEFDSHQDLHTSAWYLTQVTGATLGFWVDLLCAAYFAIVAFSFIILYDILKPNGSIVGLSLSQAMVLTSMMQYGIKQSIEIVFQMTSVERILQYTKLEKERPFSTPKTTILPKEWPDKGDINFQHVSMRYTKQTPNILKDLTLQIQPNQKVGIVGRTGAGKSSLISSLFNLSILEGSIFVDGVDVESVGLTDLRSRISIIPQQPVLFSATMRFNLDPFDEYDDNCLWEVLDEVELKEAIPSLDYQIQGGGGNFSVGQRQLICLARAILKRNKILVLDEATANVDPQTDALIQQTIRERFGQCTVLTIAHRLNTIMDSDKVLVMENGRAVEYQHPFLLLQNPNGIFTSLVKQPGSSLAKHLTLIAKTAYQQKFPKISRASITKPVTVDESSKL